MIRRPTQALVRSAFTLMEMLVVVAILVVLAGAAVPIYLSHLENAKKDRVKMDIKNLETAIDGYRIRHGEFPQSLETLTVPEDGPAVLEQKHLLDPWNGHYIYDPNDLHP